MKHMHSTRTKSIAASRRGTGDSMLRWADAGRLLFCLVLLNAVTSFGFADAEENHLHDHNAAADSNQGQVVNAYCPVRPDMKADPKFFTDYKAKRVYFCCANCRAAFNKNPEKYLSALPQFGAVPARAEHDHVGHQHELTIAAFIKPVGITTFSLLVLTAIIGLFRRRLPRFLLKWHKRLGIITLISALIHVTFVLIAH